MLINQLDRIRKIVSRIHELEDKLMNTSFMPMSEQQKIHEEIRRLKEEMTTLEKQTRK